MRDEKKKNKFVRVFFFFVKHILFFYSFISFSLFCMPSNFPSKVMKDHFDQSNLFRSRIFFSGSLDSIAIGSYCLKKVSQSDVVFCSLSITHLLNRNNLDSKSKNCFLIQSSNSYTFRSTEIPFTFLFLSFFSFFSPFCFRLSVSQASA